jgi:hypothetical protein
MSYERRLLNQAPQDEAALTIEIAIDTKPIEVE